MKKIISLFVALAFVVMFAGISSAEISGTRIGQVTLNSATLYSSTTEGYGHAHVTTSPTDVYRVSYRSASANSYAQLFNSASIGTAATTGAWISSAARPAVGGNKVLKADIGEATANDQVVVTYDPPLHFDQGVLAGMGGETGGVLTVEYRQG